MDPENSLIRRRAARMGSQAGASALATAVVTAALFAIGLAPLAWIALVAGSTVTGVQLYEWLRYRGQWGLRF